MSVYALVALAALGALPLDLVSTETVEVIELNHFYDDDGRKILDQVIFWDWHPCEGALRVRAWRMWKSLSQTPWRDWARGGYVTVWLDGERLRVVRATSLRETWTQFDPEIEDRNLLPPDRRRGL